MAKNFKNMRDYCQYIRKIFHLSTPIDMFKLITRFSIPYQNDNSKQDVIYENGIMYYDKHLSKSRINFSLARELAKLLYDNKYTNKIGNEFAAELLMPTNEFINICLNNPEENNEISLKKLANYFFVPVHAVNIRGQVLHLWR